MPDDENVLSGEMLFVQVVSMFQVAAMQHMGKIPNPVTNEIERDLEQAKISIDILGMFQDKTKGNLSQREEKFLKTAVFEAQMNYVDELKRSKDEAGKDKGGASEEPAGDRESEEPAAEESVHDEPEKEKGE